MSLPIPQAPDIEALYNIEDAVTPALVAELLERGIVHVAASRGQDESVTPRVEIEVHLGACISSAKIPAGNSERRAALPTAWNCTVVFTVATDRLNNDASHGPFRAKVRLCCAQFWNSLNTRLPYHIFEKMTEAGTKAGMINDGARTENISQISFAGIVKIRDQAWPADS